MPQWNCCRDLTGRRSLIVLLLLGTMPGVIEAADAQHQIKTRFDVRIPMRSGVHLPADVWIPVEPSYEAKGERTLS